jgi:hypothetical protein
MSVAAYMLARAILENIRLVILWSGANALAYFRVVHKVKKSFIKCASGHLSEQNSGICIKIKNRC